MIIIIKPTWEWRACQGCGSKEEIRHISFALDEESSRSTISLCSGCIQELEGKLILSQINDKPQTTEKCLPCTDCTEDDGILRCGVDVCKGVE